MIFSWIFLVQKVVLVLLMWDIIVSEFYEWPEYPSHSYTNMAEMVSPNETMTAAQLMNQLEEVGILINNLCSM